MGPAAADEDDEEDWTVAGRWGSGSGGPYLVCNTGLGLERIRQKDGCLSVHTLNLDLTAFLETELMLDIALLGLEVCTYLVYVTNTR